MNTLIVGLVCLLPSAAIAADSPALEGRYCNDEFIVSERGTATKDGWCDWRGNPSPNNFYLVCVKDRETPELTSVQAEIFEDHETWTLYYRDDTGRSLLLGLCDLPLHWGV